MTKKTTNPEQWEKQEHETTKAYAAFCAYRDLGADRSLANIIPILYGAGVNKTTKRRHLAEWSSKHGWVARVEAYDVYLEAKERHENEKAIKDMAKRHADQALHLQQKGLARILDLDPHDLSPIDALRYITEAVKIERISRGAPDQIVDYSVDVKEGSVVVYLPENNRDKPLPDALENKTEDS